MHTFAWECKLNVRADTRLWTFSTFKPFSNMYYGFAIIAAKASLFWGRPIVGGKTQSQSESQSERFFIELNVS